MCGINDLLMISDLKRKKKLKLIATKFVFFFGFTMNRRRVRDFFVVYTLVIGKVGIQFCGIYFCDSNKNV